MRKIIHYFAEKHILTNFLLIAVFIGAVVFWNKTGKEEMPNMTFDFVRITANYPGATADEVEHFITREIEDALEGIDGIVNVNSSSSQESCSVSVELEPNNPLRDEVIAEIKDAAENVNLPDDVEKQPRVREFKSSRRPIIDIYLVHKEADIMNEEQRREVQEYADALENRLLRLSHVSEVGKSGYLDFFIQVEIDPSRLLYYNLSLQNVMSAISAANIKQPIGTLEDSKTTRIQLDAALYELEAIKNVVIRSSFEGKFLRLKDVAVIKELRKSQNSITKVNGSEAIRLNVTKTSASGILEAVDQVKEAMLEYNRTALKGSDVEIILMDDESVGVRGRLSLIAMNGFFGFILILIILFLFLDVRSAFWVAMGIPFTFGFTMIFASLMGNSVNNITLAAVIIVMGMIVDDAIVVAENVTRLIHDGMDREEAVVKGTVAVFLPIAASITTTCVAFIPLYFFQGRFAMMTRYIPPIIYLMLGGSLFEALFILPSHLGFKFPRWVRIVFSLGLIIQVEKYYARKKKKITEENGSEKSSKNGETNGHWFMYVENFFGRLLKHILRVKWLVFGLFFCLLILSARIFIKDMKFSMFPREETTTVFLSGSTPRGTDKYETEKMARSVEEIFSAYLGREVFGFQTQISRTRRGSAARENVFSVFIELVPREERDKTSSQLIKEWEKELESVAGEFETLRFGRGWFGQSSGSPIDIIIKEDDDTKRYAIARLITDYFKRMPAIENPEIQTVLSSPKYSLGLKRDLIHRLDISPSTLISTLRTAINGNNVFNITREGREIEVVATLMAESKKDINAILNLPIENNSRYLIPLKDMVNVEMKETPDTINHYSGKRILHVYGDLTERNRDNPENNSRNGNRNRHSNSAGENEKTKMDPEELKQLLKKAREGDKDAREKVKELRQKGLLPDREGSRGENKTTAGEKKKSDGNKEKTDSKREDKEEKIEKLDLPVSMTPLEIAEHLETELFPEIYGLYPSSQLQFAGEIADTRESKKDFQIAIGLVILLIYVILALTLGSLTKPLIIMLSIPFGCVGIILALKLHGMNVYGFFSMIGALGLAGVVVNDSIILLVKLEREFPKRQKEGKISEVVADITKTRLRAVLLTTITTVAGLLPTAYGVFGYDSMLAEMMLTMAWGLMFGTLITLFLVPALYCSMKEWGRRARKVVRRIEQ